MTDQEIGTNLACLSAHHLPRLRLQKTFQLKEEEKEDNLEEY